MKFKLFRIIVNQKIAFKKKMSGVIRQKQVEESPRRMIYELSLGRMSSQDDSPLLRKGADDFSPRHMEQRYGHISYGDGSFLDLKDLDNSLPVLKGSSMPIVPQLSLKNSMSKRKHSRKNIHVPSAHTAQISSANSVKESTKKPNSHQCTCQTSRERKDEPKITDPLPNIRVPQTIKLRIEPHQENSRELNAQNLRQQLQVTITPSKRHQENSYKKSKRSPRSRLSHGEASPHARRICDENFLDYLRKTIQTELPGDEKANKSQSRAKPQQLGHDLKFDRSLNRQSSRLRRLVDMNKTNSQSWELLRQQLNQFRASALNIPSAKGEIFSSARPIGAESSLVHHSQSESLQMVKNQSIKKRRKTDAILNILGPLRYSNADPVTKRNLECAVKPIPKVVSNRRIEQLPKKIDDYNMQVHAHQLPTYQRKPKSHSKTKPLHSQTQMQSATSQGVLKANAKLPIRSPITTSTFKMTNRIQASPSPTQWSKPQTKDSLRHAESTLESDQRFATLHMSSIDERLSQHEQTITAELLLKASQQALQTHQSNYLYPQHGLKASQNSAISKSGQVIQSTEQQRAVVFSSKLTSNSQSQNKDAFLVAEAEQVNGSYANLLNHSAMLFNENTNFEGTAESFRLSSNALFNRRLPSHYFDESN